MNAHHKPDAAPVLLREDAGGIALLTLNRPQARNPLSEAMLAALSDAFRAIAADRSVKVVVLSAAGPVFSAGHDLKEMTAHRADPDRGRAYFADILGRCSAMMQQITALPQPVIAAVEGTATAAGCQLVGSCDLAVAGEDARFCTPGVHIGLFSASFMVAGIAIGLPYGPHGVALAYSSVMVLKVIPITIWALHGTGVRVREFAGALMSPLAACAIAALVGFGVHSLCPQSMAPVLRLLLDVGSFGAAYLSALLLIAGEKALYLDLFRAAKASASV